MIRLDIRLDCMLMTTMFCWEHYHCNPLPQILNHRLLVSLDKLYIGDRRFDADVSDAPVFKISEAMDPVSCTLWKYRPDYVDTSTTQWERYLLTKVSPDLKLHLDVPDVWLKVNLSDEGVFKSGDNVLKLATDHDFVYVFLKFIRSGLSLVCHPKDSSDRSADAFSYHLTALVVSEMFVWDSNSCKEHIYDKLIQQLYVSGRSDFLKLNASREKSTPLFQPQKLRIHRRGRDRVEFYKSLTTLQLDNMGYFSVPLFPKRADYDLVKTKSTLCNNISHTMSLLF